MLIDDKEKATKKQTWTIFTLSGKDVREQGLSKEEASQMIKELMRTRDKEKIEKQVKFQQIWDEAYTAGNKALEECRPTPMVVAQHSDMLDDSSPIDKSWFVEGGACGFAWVNIAPGTQPFAKWVKSRGYGSRDSYYGGITIWCKEGGQSVERKTAWCGAFSRVLDKYDIKSYTYNRLD